MEVKVFEALENISKELSITDQKQKKKSIQKYYKKKIKIYIYGL
jgi:hypothetical protein